MRTDGDPARLCGGAEHLGVGQRNVAQIEALKEGAVDAVHEDMPDVRLDLDPAQDAHVVLLGQRRVVSVLEVAPVLGQNEAVDVVAVLAARLDPLAIALDGPAGIVGAIGRVHVQVEVGMFSHENPSRCAAHHARPRALE